MTGAVYNVGGWLWYWRTTAGSEVDFIRTRRTRAVGVLIKASVEWRSDNGAPLMTLAAEGALEAGIGVNGLSLHVASP